MAAVPLASCGDPSSKVTSVTKTSATFAEQPGAIPNYILPLATSQFYSAANIFQFQYLMYRPLYSFGGGGRVALNDALSLADAPVYSDGGKSVTITLKGWKWSDGVPITARDVQFWQNLVTANKVNWPAYVPGEYPDNVVGSTISPQNPLQITFSLSQAFGSYFFTYNELSQITPLPQHEWDKEAASGPVGNYDETPAGARAVYAFLDSQSRSVVTYQTNPLWSVVSGPWRLKSMDTAGNVQMVPNPEYGGPVKPTLKVFRELPFTQASDEFNKLKAATSVSNTSVDFGYLPADEAQQKSALGGVYRLSAWSPWSINYIPFNFTNPTSGPIFSKLYFRQAMQYLVDQRQLVEFDLSRICQSDVWPCPDRGSVPVRRSAGAEGHLRVQPNRCAIAAPGERLDGQRERGEHLFDTRHRYRRLWCGHQAGAAGVVHPRIRKRQPGGDRGDASTRGGLRAGWNRGQAGVNDVRRGRGIRRAVHPRDRVLVGPGVLGQPMDLRPGLLPLGRPTLGLHGLRRHCGVRRIQRWRVLRPSGGVRHRRHRDQ